MHPTTFLASFTYSLGQETFMLTTKYKTALEKKKKLIWAKIQHKNVLEQINTLSGL